MSNSNFQDLDQIITWKPYTFDGINPPSTGVLCKWENGMIGYFDPNINRCDNIRFIESDEPKESEKKYVPWMEGGTEKEETIEGICGLIFIGLIIGLLVTLRCLGV